MALVVLLVSSGLLCGDVDAAECAQLIHSRARQALGRCGAARFERVTPAARAAIGEEQASWIGNQTGGRVFLFLYTDDFWRDFHAYKAKGVVFVREPKEESYGTVAVFKDLYGNLWDLLQLKH